jgi:hypothetical protein
MRFQPAKCRIAALDTVQILWHGRTIHLPYFYREGAGGPSILFVHGLGGAKENFYAAMQSPALTKCSGVVIDTRIKLAEAHYPLKTEA